VSPRACPECGDPASLSKKRCQYFCTECEFAFGGEAEVSVPAYPAAATRALKLFLTSTVAASRCGRCGFDAIAPGIDLSQLQVEEKMKGFRYTSNLQIVVMFALMLFGVSALKDARASTECGDLVSQAEMTICASNELYLETAKINSIYNDLRLKLGSKDKNKLKEIQLAWIRFRDLSCQFESLASEGGSVNSMIMSLCLIRYTRQRMIELEILNNCKEGDLGCPFSRK
jgi:uncharacterized protein YecT (DUF1311 family)